MRESKSPYSFGGNGASSLAQTIGKIGEAFSGLNKEKQRLNDKMLDSEIRIRERATNELLKSSLKKKEMKTAGKVERKTYKGQVKTNVKAAERLTGTEKGQGVVKGGSKVSFGRERMDFTAKDAPKPETTAKPKTSKPATKPAAKPASKPVAAPKPTATPKATPAAKSTPVPKPAAKKVK